MQEASTTNGTKYHEGLIPMLFSFV